MLVGIRLKQLRKSKKLSQVELAKKLNVSQSTIAYYENEEKQPGYETLKQIADLFEVSVDYLLGRIDTPVDYTESEKQLLNVKELTPEYLSKNYSLVIDGQEATKEEIEEVIKYIKAIRIMKKVED